MGLRGKAEVSIGTKICTEAQCRNAEGHVNPRREATMDWAGTKQALVFSAKWAMKGSAWRPLEQTKTTEVVKWANQEVTSRHEAYNRLGIRW